MAQAGTTLYAPTALHEQIAAKGIPVIGVSGPPWVVTYDPSATQAQKDQGNSIAAAFDGQNRKYRLLYKIYQALQGLTQTQRDKIWANLSSADSVAGVPRKYLSTAGVNAGPIFNADDPANDTSLPAARQQAARQRIEAFYVQDNPYYLDAPAFDPTITILGIDPV